MSWFQRRAVVVWGPCAKRVMKIWSHLSCMLQAWSFTVQELAQGPALQSCTIWSSQSQTAIALGVLLKLRGRELVPHWIIHEREHSQRTPSVLSQLEMSYIRLKGNKHMWLCFTLSLPPAGAEEDLAQSLYKEDKEAYPAQKELWCRTAERLKE